MASKAIAALGFAPHSGWAAMIAAEEVDGGLRVFVRDRIEMVDPREPASKQPYHAAEDLPLAEATALLARYAETAERKAHQAIERIVGELSKLGHRVSGIGILESAGRKGAALPDILASHALIHTADGDHFREAIAGGATRCGLTTARVPARELDARAAAAVGKPIETLRLTLREVGRELGPPWTADQKAAALLAWTILAEAPADRVGARRRP